MIKHHHEKKAFNYCTCTYIQNQLQSSLMRATYFLGVLFNIIRPPTIISDDLLALLVIPAILATILAAAAMLCTIFYCYRRSRAKGHNVLANSTVATETSSMTDTYSHLNHCAYHHHNDSSNKPTSNTTNDRRMVRQVCIWYT